jgi:integrase
MGRRSSKAFPEPQLHRAKGLLRLRVDGREFWLGKPGTRQADERRAEILAAWGANGGSLPADFNLNSTKPRKVVPKVTKQITNAITVGDLLEITLSEIGGGKTPEELRNVARWWMLRKVADVLQPYFRTPAADFGPRILGDAIRLMANTPMKNGKGLPTKKYCREVAAEIRRIFKQAVAREQVDAERLVALNALTELPTENARDSVERDPVGTEIVEDTCAVLPPVVADLLRFILLTGCRPSEATSATPSVIDTTVTPWVLRPKTHKTKKKGHDRIIQIGPKARAIITRWQSSKQSDELIFSRDELKRATTSNMITLHTLKSDRQEFSRDDFKRFLKRAIAKQGVPHWSPYQLRHTGLTAIREIGGRDAAQAQAGHSDGAITERYTRKTLENAASEIVERIG